MSGSTREYELHLPLNKRLEPTAERRGRSTPIRAAQLGVGRTKSGCMTKEQLYLFIGLYLVLLVVVAILTRATARRIIGALAGGLAVGVAGLAIIALGERAKWWHQVLTWQLYFLALLLVDFALCAFVFLITWRIARRFGSRGLAVAVVFAAIIGPPRDYWYMARFPEWGFYARGVVPVLAISASYILLGILGHGVMRLVAGPAREDRLARRPWVSGRGHR